MNLYIINTSCLFYLFIKLYNIKAYFKIIFIICILMCIIYVTFINFKSIIFIIIFIIYILTNVCNFYKLLTFLKLCNSTVSYFK